MKYNVGDKVITIRRLSRSVPKDKYLGLTGIISDIDEGIYPYYIDFNGVTCRYSWRDEELELYLEQLGEI